METTLSGLGIDREEDPKGKRERSPAFPFISLEKAVERARDFAKDYRRNEARIINIGEQWGFRPKSSTTLQTIAALKYFGLMEETGGAKDDRRIKLTELAWRILNDERPGMREKALQEAALRPRVIMEQWQAWGTARLPDRDCVSELHLEKDFTPDAARRFLTVYDETILYAKLAENATLLEQGSNKNNEDNGDGNGQNASLLSIQPKGSEVDLMEDERVVYSYESQPDNRVRLILSGLMNENLLEALEIYVELQKRKLQAQKALEGIDATRQLPLAIETQQSQPTQEPEHSWEPRTGERSQPINRFSPPARPVHD